MSGLARQWAAAGKRWVVFLQDTNGLIFRSIPAVLGVSKTEQFELNSIAIPRKKGESVGAICRLDHADGRSLTINVEYNQLDNLLKNTVGEEQLDEFGFSVYPGNTNALVFSIPQYVKTLEATSGLISEFINPKYVDATKTKFKSSTRLECMMQDYPKLMAADAKVGLSQVDRSLCFSTVKNDLKTAAQKFSQNIATECAGSCEEDLFRLNARLLELAGARVEYSQEKQTFEGISYCFGPLVVLHPSFGVTIEEISRRIKGNVIIHAKSTLVLKGDITLENVEVDGVLFLDDSKTKEHKDIKVSDKQYNHYVKVDVASKGLLSYLKIRGFDLN